MLLRRADGLHEPLRSQMSVSLGRDHGRVSQRLLDVVERHALVNQSGGERMAQVMDAETFQAGDTAGPQPATLHLGERFTSCRVGKHPAICSAVVAQ